MLTNADILIIQEMEDHCIAHAQRLATGKNNCNVSLSELISSMNFETRKRLYKPLLEFSKTYDSH